MTPFGVLVGKIHSREGYPTGVPTRPHPHRVVDGWLRGKWKCRYAGMTQIALIRRDFSGIACEYDVELFGRWKKIIVMWRVFLIPKYGWNSVLPAPSKECQKLWLRTGSTHQLVFPGSAVAIPG
ncbi:hypothetical protein ACIPY2_14235 [Paenarthrobacter sp. NPDC089675]|uniref:hypothetical protein n=1 Tax=Paenarthrobacter sp. NPDC089675 TaxID=3364376 RepID=UPI0037FA792E